MFIPPSVTYQRNDTDSIYWRYTTFTLDYLHVTVVPQNLPSLFFTRNHSFGLFLIFQIGSRIGQTDFSYQSKLGFPLILNQSKQIIRVFSDLVEFGSGFDQADASLTINQELGFARAFSDYSIIIKRRLKIPNTRKASKRITYSLALATGDASCPLLRLFSKSQQRYCPPFSFLTPHRNK